MRHPIITQPPIRKRRGLSFLSAWQPRIAHAGGVVPFPPRLGMPVGVTRFSANQSQKFAIINVIYEEN